MNGGAQMSQSPPVHAQLRALGRDELKETHSRILVSTHMRTLAQMYMLMCIPPGTKSRAWLLQSSGGIRGNFSSPMTLELGSSQDALHCKQALHLSDAVGTTRAEA